jgi:hypothetical protein
MKKSHLPVTVKDLTNYWCRTLGIQSKDLGCGIKFTDTGVQLDSQSTHAQIDDVIVLIKFLQEYLNELPNSHRIRLHMLWHWVYTEKKALTKRNHRQLKRFTRQLENRRFQKQQAKQKAREKIKALKNPAI